MKNLTLIFLTINVLFFSSCGEDEPEPEITTSEIDEVISTLIEKKQVLIAELISFFPPIRVGRDGEKVAA